jgi:molybdate transport system substrate-binding protein
LSGFPSVRCFLLMLFLAVSWPLRAEEPPAIAAAADLKFALTEVAERFGAETGRQVKLSFGSSGNFARQIEQGAPFQLFLSADESYVVRLAAQGLTEDDGTLYAIGRIVVFAPTGSQVRADAELRDVKTALADGRLRRLAIANPDHAPYGRAAREALEHAGIWALAAPALVLGENASQAAQFATSGSAQAGIIPYSLALAPAVASRGAYALLPEDWHRPLRQRMALLNGAGETARRFHDYLREPGARKVLERYGFVLPAR